MDLSRRRKGRRGHRTSMVNAWEVPSIHRTSCRKSAAKAGVSLASLWRLCQEEKVRKVKRWIRPVLSDQQKVDSVGSVLSHTHRRGGGWGIRGQLYDWVRVDEKWFYILKDGKDVYLHPTEPPLKPPRAQNKKLITKMMFLAAVARPRKMSNGVWFDGKIGIWPIVDSKVAQRTTKHRPKGTKVCVPAMVDEEMHKKLMIEAVIPAIKACMPRPEGHTIFVQQDGATPHTKVRTMEAIEEAVGGDMVIEALPANSPDLNVNDLGLFHSIAEGIRGGDQHAGVGGGHNRGVRCVPPGYTRARLAEPIRSLRRSAGVQG
ncbi:unnamed protein product [Discosporangium mesarthrocarpum]